MFIFSLFSRDIICLAGASPSPEWRSQMKLVKFTYHKSASPSVGLGNLWATIESAHQRLPIRYTPPAERETLRVHYRWRFLLLLLSHDRLPLLWNAASESWIRERFHHAGQSRKEKTSMYGRRIYKKKIGSDLPRGGCSSCCHGED